MAKGLLVLLAKSVRQRESTEKERQLSNISCMILYGMVTKCHQSREKGLNFLAGHQRVVAVSASVLAL